MFKGDSNKINRSASEEGSYSASLMKFYRRIGVVFIPLVALYVLLSFFDFYALDNRQIITPIMAIIAGVYVFIFYKYTWAQNTFIYVHLVLLSSMTLVGFLNFTQNPTDQNLISLLLLIFLTGIMLIESKSTIIYFIATVSTITILSFTTDIIDFKYAFFILLCGVIVVGFTLWREKLTYKLSLAKESYENLFSDSSELIFVLDTDTKIIELNKSAADYVKKAIEGNVRGQLFDSVFCAKENTETDKFHAAIEKVKQEEKIKFEAQCVLANSTVYSPKEFTIRKGIFLEKEVFVVVIRLIKDQREYEQKLIESKENISKVLDNINSFIYNITYDLSGNHQVNYVSNKVLEVFGIDTDEYITLIKSSRLNEIFYHEDREETTKMFNDIIETGKQNRIRFRIVRNGEIRWVEEKIFPEKINENVVFLFGIVTDITDQIDALATIKESEKRYRQIFERNMAGVYKTHSDGTILEANPAFARILGFQTATELIGQNIKDFYDELSDRKSYLELLRSEGAINNYISKLRRKDGRKLILNNNVSIQPDEDGNLNIIEGTLIDITDLEETANALKLSEEKYRLLFEEANTGILLFSAADDDIHIVDSNQVGLQLFGYKEKELIGLKLSVLAVEGKLLKERISALNKSTNKREKVEIEWQFNKKNGQRFFAEVAFISIILGQEKIIQAVIKDISERKKNERELLESQRSFRNIVDNSPTSILIFTENKLVYLNPSGQRIYKDLLIESENLFEVFPEKLKFVIEDLLHENNEESNSYTEIDLGDTNETKKFSLSVVKTVYNNKPSDLFLLHDITLQNEYSTQKLRAEIAEETNKTLQQEIVNHRKTQAELLEKTFWLNALFESSYNLFILSIDKDYRLSSFNDNFKRMIKRNLDIEVKIGDNFLDIFNTSPKAREKIEARFEKVLAGKTLELVSHFPSKNGEIWAESFLNPVKLGDREIHEISFISHDITEKIEAQRKTKLSEANNKAILLAMPDILFKVNKEGYFTDYRINQLDGKETISGFFNTESIVGSRVSAVFTNEPSAKKFMGHVQRAIDKNELITDTFEFKSEGKKVYYENRFSKMNDDEVIVLSRNITETMEYETMLVESVREKEILLKEVHHRVKNNLQVINSILNLQSSYVDDPKTLEIINESQNRIRSMSYIHESLYQTKDFSSINFDDYITNLVQNLVHSYQLYEDKTNLELKIDPVQLALDQAIPCGLILNELVSNALKYAYPEGEIGKIFIQVFEKDKKVIIKVEDYGIGLPDNFKVENSESLGLSLVYTLVDQLDGELILKTDGGTKFLITFEKQDF